MKFGSQHAWQITPGTTEDQVWAEEAERIRLAEALGYHSVWVPEQHFFDYCGTPDALTMATWVAGTTSRVRIGTGVSNLTLTNPIRFAERASMIDRLSGGRVDLTMGRGYQWPQNLVFGVDDAETKAMFQESLDIILGLWSGEPFGYEGEHWNFPPVRIYPKPVRPASEVLVHAVGGTTQPSELIARGLPMAISMPFSPVEVSANAFKAYADAVAESTLDTDLMLDRSMVLVYGLLAPTKEEARALQRDAYTWQMARIATLSHAKPEGETWESIRSSPNPPPLPDEMYDHLCETSLFFDDPDTFCDKLAVLDDAGVRHVVVWMGPGGVAQEHVVRGMQLLAEEVMPRFR